MNLLRPVLRFATACHVALAVAAICLTASASAPPADQVIDGQLHQLGKRASRDQRKQPRLDVRFESMRNPTEFTLRLTHRNVMQPWFLEVNGRRLAPIPLAYGVERQSYFTVPTGVLTNGSNTLSFVGENFGREVSVGNVRLFRQPLRELLKLRRVAVTVTDAQTGKTRSRAHHHPQRAGRISGHLLPVRHQCRCSHRTGLQHGAQNHLRAPGGTL